MKPTLIFTLLCGVFAVPHATAMSELDALRARCAAQEQQIQRLEGELRRLKPSTAGALASAANSQTTTISTTQSGLSSTTSRGLDAGTYVVAAGDSLEKIANRKDCTVPALLKANGLKPTAIIHPGQKLKLPASLGKIADATPAAIPGSGKTYTIRSGDTFAGIAKNHKTTVAALVSANPEVKPNSLRPGQTIRLSSAEASTSMPVAKQSASTPVGLSARNPLTEPKPAQPHPAKAESTTATAPAQSEAPASANPSSPSNPEKKIRSVTIEGEMTYGEFAAKHGTDTSRLNDLNGLDLTNATVLAKGSELYVPAQP